MTEYEYLFNNSGSRSWHLTVKLCDKPGTAADYVVLKSALIAKSGKAPEDDDYGTENIDMDGAKYVLVELRKKSADDDDVLAKRCKKLCETEAAKKVIERVVVDIKTGGPKNVTVDVEGFASNGKERVLTDTLP